jgi:hypothetical protein
MMSEDDDADYELVAVHEQPRETRCSLVVDVQLTRPLGSFDAAMDWYFHLSLNFIFIFVPHSKTFVLFCR